MLWNQIIGHADIIGALQGVQRTGRVPHAMLFVGPDGVGKMLTALTFAAALLCRQDHAPCGECLACRQVLRREHPDLIMVQPDGNTIKIDQIRSVQHEAALAPQESERRICIIEDADRLTEQAANSLLKLLEEPPAGFTWVLVSSKRHRLLPTILSRCRLYLFEPLSAELVVQALPAGDIPEAKRMTAARLSAGAVGNARTLLKEGGLDRRDQAAEIIFSLAETASFAVWPTVDALEKLDSRELLQTLKYMLYVLRDLIVTAEGQDSKMLLNTDLAEKMRMQAGQWPRARLYRAMQEVRSAVHTLTVTNANSRLACEALFLRLSEI